MSIMASDLGIDLVIMRSIGPHSVLQARDGVAADEPALSKF